MEILLFMIAGGLAVGVIYSAIKLREDAAAGRHGLGFLGLLSLLGSLGALVFLGLLLGFGLH
jgi:xanthosine utilization system XapX-like protein